MAEKKAKVEKAVRRVEAPAQEQFVSGGVKVPPAQDIDAEDGFMGA